MFSHPRRCRAAIFSSSSTGITSLMAVYYFIALLAQAFYFGHSRFYYRHSGHRARPGRWPCLLSLAPPGTDYTTFAANFHRFVAIAFIRQLTGFPRRNNCFNFPFPPHSGSSSTITAATPPVWDTGRAFIPRIPPAIGRRRHRPPPALRIACPSASPFTTSTSAHRPGSPAFQRSGSAATGPPAPGIIQSPAALGRACPGPGLGAGPGTGRRAGRASAGPGRHRQHRVTWACTGRHRPFRHLPPARRHSRFSSHAHQAYRPFAISSPPAPD